jgi:predicted ATPase
MSESRALALWKALESLGEEKSLVAQALARRILEHPVLQPWHDDPLRTLGGVYPSLDALTEIAQARPESEESTVGTLWGALYLPAEGSAVPVQVRAARTPDVETLVAARPLSPEVERSAQAAWEAARKLLPESGSGLCYDIEAEGIDSELAAAVAGDSLGLPLALAFWSALTEKPLPDNLGATGAIQGDRIAPVGWVEAKRDALSQRGVRTLAPGEVKTLKEALDLIFPAEKPDLVGLPEELSPLVGRAQEREALAALLGERQVRLITLLGFGGVGKTRLALETARHVAGLFPDGVWFVPLEEALTEQDVLRAIATKLGAESGALESRLAGRRLLLVLDNFEQALAGAPALGRLLRNSPDVFCLVTSRIALGIRGERRFDIDGLPPADAEALFYARATEVGTALPTGCQAQIQAICQRLDGLPLALELAAARLRHLSLSELQERLDDALGVLATRSRDVPERQRTVRATLEWSIGLLESDEKRLLRALSVFESSFTARAAEALLGEDVLDEMAQLEAASLLRVERGGRETRFRLRVLVRELAIELRESAHETTYWEENHDAYFLQRAQDAWLTTQDDVPRYDSLERDMDSFRSLFRRIHEAPEAFPAAAVAALTRVLRRRGCWHETREFLSYVRQKPRQQVTLSDAAKLLLARASLERLEGKLPQAERSIRWARNLATRLGDTLLEAETHVVSATLHARHQRIEQAQTEIARALKTFESHKDSLGQIAALGNRAVILYRTGDYSASEKDFATLAALARQRGSRLDEMQAQVNRAEVLVLQERWSEAQDAAWSALELARESPANVTPALHNLGRALLAHSPEAARPFLYGAQELHRRFPLDASAAAELEEAITKLPEGRPALAARTLQQLLDVSYWRAIAAQNPPG